MRALASLLLVSVLFAVTAAQNESNPAAGMTSKLDHITRNSSLANPDPSPTVFAEQEVNAYFGSGQIKLPAGVQSVRFQGQPGIVIGNARVDFDALKAGRHSLNPLLSMFSGVHDVEVNADAHGTGGEGLVHINTVALDGVEIPHFVLQLFVEKYLQPKYPQIGLDSRFRLPDRIDTAVVGLHKLTVAQR